MPTQAPLGYLAPKDLLADQVILVTGAGDGIGRAVALASAQHGATVILLGRTVAKLEAVYDQIEAIDLTPQPAIYPMDLMGAAPTDYAEMAATIQSQFGALNGIVHSAAQLPYLSRLKDYEPEDWMKVMQVNLNAAFLLTQACLPVLQSASQASVIFTTDHSATQSQPFWGAYGVAKSGVNALAMMWATELAKTAVRVNLLDPGPTLTGLRKKNFPAANQENIQLPETVAPAYLWLLGQDSQDVRGENVTLK